MFWRRFFPEREVQGLVLVILTVKLTGAADHVFEVPAGQDAVMMLAIVFTDIEIYRAVAHVCESCVQNFLYQSYLLHDMAGSARFYGRRSHVQHRHGLVVPDGVLLGDFHRFHLLQTGFLGYFVLTFIRIVLQMSHVSDIPDIADLVS